MYIKVWGSIDADGELTTNLFTDVEYIMAVCILYKERIALMFHEGLSFALNE